MSRKANMVINYTVGIILILVLLVTLLFIAGKTGGQIKEALSQLFW